MRCALILALLVQFIIIATGISSPVGCPRSLFCWGQTETIADKLTGNLGITWPLGGTLTLNGSNTFTGGVKVTSGTVVAGNATALSSGSVTVTATGNNTAQLTMLKSVTIPSLTLSATGGGTSALYLDSLDSGTNITVAVPTVTLNTGGNLRLSVGGTNNQFVPTLNGSVMVTGGTVTLVQGPISASTGAGSISGSLNVTNGALFIGATSTGLLGTDNRLTVNGNVVLASGTMFSSAGIGPSILCMGPLMTIGSGFGIANNVTISPDANGSQTLLTDTIVPTLGLRSTGNAIKSVGSLTGSLTTIGTLQFYEYSPGTTGTLFLLNNMTATGNSVNMVGNGAGAGTTVGAAIDLNGYMLTMNATTPGFTPGNMAGNSVYGWTILNSAATSGTLIAPAFVFTSASNGVTTGSGVTLVATGATGASNLSNITGTNTNTISQYTTFVNTGTGASLSCANRGIGSLVNSATAGTFTTNVLPTTGSFTQTGGVGTTYTGTSTTISGPVTLNSGIFTNSGAAITMSGSVTVLGSPDAIRGVQSTTISGLITGTSFSKTDGGTLTLSNTANTFYGPTQMSTGTVSYTYIANTGNPCSTGTQSQLFLGQNYAGSQGVGSLQYSGTYPSVSTNKSIYIGNGATGGGAILDNISAGTTVVYIGNLSTATPAQPSTLTLQGVGNGVFSGNVTGSPALSITKTGAGTWSITGSCSATGTTTINQGTLCSGTASSGTAYIVGPVLVSNSTGATLQAGSFGNNVLNTGALTLAGSLSQVTINGNAATVSDINVTGACALGGATINLSGSTNAGTYTLISSSGSMTGTLPVLGTDTATCGAYFNQVGNALQVTLANYLTTDSGNNLTTDSGVLLTQ